MWKALTADSILPYALIGMTAVRSCRCIELPFPRARIHSKHDWKHRSSALASTGVPQVYLARSITALLDLLQVRRLAVASWQAQAQWCSFVRRVRSFALEICS
jgi:hypothetical protein